MKTSQLTTRQKRFVAEYLIDFNATQAAIRSGYSARTANREGSRLLSNVDIAREVEEGRKRITERCELTVQRVLDEIGRVAFADCRTFFDEYGNLKPLNQLTAAQGSQMAGFEVILKNAQAGDGVIDRVHKFKLWDKTRALELAAKYFGLLKDKVEHSVEVSEEAKALADVFSTEELLAIRERIRTRPTDRSGSDRAGPSPQTPK